MRHGILGLTTIVLAAALAGCSEGKSGSARLPAGERESAPSGLPQGSGRAIFDPAQFTIEIDNPWWPMAPGNRWVYSQTDAQGSARRVEVTVTNWTKVVMGIEARVVHDVVTENGELLEETFDWYAQDVLGNVWYLGEDTTEYESGLAKSSVGSWQAGVEEAQPGVVVPARPYVGLAYRQEHLDGAAEDSARVLSLDMRAKVPYGFFDHVLVTKEHAPLESGLVEHKFYARGVGPVLAVTLSGGSDRERLILFDGA